MPDTTDDARDRMIAALRKLPPDLRAQVREGITDRPRHCFAVFPDQRDEGGFIPSVVYEGEGGHYPLRGRGAFAIPWHWGQEYEKALAVCADANRDLGLTEDDVEEIVTSSIAAQLRGE